MLRQATSGTANERPFDDIPPAGDHAPTVDPATCSVSDLLRSFGVDVDYVAEEPAEAFDPFAGGLDEEEASLSDDEAGADDEPWEWFAEHEPPTGGKCRSRTEKPPPAADDRHFWSAGVRYRVATDVPAGETDAEAAVRVAHAITNGSRDPVVRFLGDAAAAAYVQYSRTAQQAWDVLSVMADGRGGAVQLLRGSEQLQRLLVRFVRAAWALELGRARAPKKAVDDGAAAVWNSPLDVEANGDPGDDFHPVRAALLGDIEPGNFTIEEGLSRMDQAACGIAIVAFHERPDVGIDGRLKRPRDRVRLTKVLGILFKVSIGAREARHEFEGVATRRPLRVTVTWVSPHAETSTQEPVPEMALPELTASCDSVADDDGAFVA